MTTARNCLGFGLAALATAMVLRPAGAQTLPTDPQGGCPITPAAVAAMFESGSVTLNGVAKPADSTLVLAPNCGFFTWSEQMFLWLTSPAPRRYGGGSRIMFSPSFYTVSPADSNGRRDFIKNQVGVPFRMLLRATELGPHGRPALLARTGQVIEVAEVVRRPVRTTIRLQSGATVQLGDVRRAPGGQLQFLDIRGRTVQPRKLVLPRLGPQTMIRMPDGKRMPVLPVAAVKDAIQARKLIFRDIPIFLDASGNVIDVEPGQADGGVLLAQNGSLIYYISTVNDQFAYHRTMQGPAVIPFNTSITFPMTMADANAVKAFAAAHGHTLVDPEALAIETKSSWVEASSVPNPADYIQVDATIPTYDKSNPNMWVSNGQKNVKLVMVGLHVVGSTNGHGEMVWGSFEHLGNAPNGPYSYTSTTGVKNVPQNTSGTWLFTPSGSAGPFNNMNASWDTSTGNLNGTPVAPTAVLRTRPWGTLGTNTSLNTQVISSNASIISQLVAGDVRAKYFQLGTTWTIGGAAPNNGNQVGTAQLANATIETFMQAAGAGGTGSNCFSCHGTNKVVVSHLYPEMNPLF